MSSPQTDAFTEAVNQTKALQQKAYGIALPALSKEYSVLNQALAQGGEPDYLKSAFTGARGAATEGILKGSADRMRADAAGKKYAIASGNVGLVTPQALGSELAKALYGTRVSEAAGQVEQMDKLMGMSLGQSQQTGSAALGATGNELADIGMMRNYNQGYAGILAALNAGGTIYGAMGQRPDPYAAAIAPGGTSGSFGWQGFTGSGGT